MQDKIQKLNKLKDLTNDIKLKQALIDKIELLKANNTVTKWT